MPKDINPILPLRWEFFFKRHKKNIQCFRIHRMFCRFEVSINYLKQSDAAPIIPASLPNSALLMTISLV